MRFSAIEMSCFAQRLIAGCCVSVACAATLFASDEIQFNRDVRPILSNSCFTCHGPDEGQRDSDHRFDTEAGVSALADAGIIIAGKPDASELIERITSDDPDVQMPPPDHPRQLAPRDIEILRRWIEQGAKWQPHWSFVVPQRPPVPKVEEGEQPAGAIDAFVHARLQREELTPVGPADKRTLLRRLSLDLTGLPPTTAELERFLADDSPDAYEREVDRLLASERYGERMAFYWLDLARYADSVGYHKDSHQEVWLYRDYVITAFNNNKPYDQFVTEQIAGDLLGGSAFQQYERKIASGFNRLHQTTSEGGAQAKEYLAKYSADRVRNTAALFQGVTMGCAECHDHKYDPITARDFYSFAAFFGDLQERGVGVPQPTPMPSIEQIAAGRQLEMQLQQLQQEEGSGAEVRQKIAELQQQIAELANPKDKKWPKTLVTQSGKPRTIRYLPRGNWLDDSGPVMSPAVPVSLGAIDDVKQRPSRLELARWMVDRDNPLTARVFVNRLWRLMMGEGISRTVDDLGAQGEWPSHPALLDWLAVEFIDSGWDVKHMAKLIVMSDTYRRSSIPTEQLNQRDPENRLLARQNRFRLPAEMIRDNALAISGLLSEKMYGRSVKPYQPANYWYRMYHQGKYQQDHGEDLYRRGVYTYWRRSFWHPNMALFDAPSREECVARRPRSNTPLQALALLNDTTYVEAARVFAERIIRSGGKDAKARAHFAMTAALCRPPAAWEEEAILELLEDQRKRYAEDEEAARKLISTGEHPVPMDIPPAELAAWTSLARAILNLHETITRN